MNNDRERTTGNEGLPNLGAGTSTRTSRCVMSTGGENCYQL